MAIAATTATPIDRIRDIKRFMDTPQSGSFRRPDSGVEDPENQHGQTRDDAIKA
jgi:hypothetical protein